jgi:hypothetical protein
MSLARNLPTARGWARFGVALRDSPLQTVLTLSEPVSRPAIPGRRGGGFDIEFTRLRRGLVEKITGYLKDFYARAA